MDCECPVAGYCERYKRNMLGRLHDICAGTAKLTDGTLLPQEKREAYQRLWLAAANGEPLPAKQTAPAPEKNYGPGTELKAIFESLGIKFKMTCPCAATIRWMNELGGDGCREHKDEIVKKIQDGRKSFGWTEHAIAAAKAVKTGVVFKINWASPFPGLVDEAIRRAEKPRHAIPKHP